MSWFLLILSVAALAGLHLWWSRRLGALEAEWRRRMEQGAQESGRGVAEMQARQQSIFDSMTEGLLLLDSDGRIQFANSAFKAIFGVGEEIRSRTVIEALRIHELADLVRNVQEHGETVRAQLRLPGPPERWLEVNAAPVGASNERFAATVVVCHDLTPFRQLESTRRDFVANVTHELRTPLSLIKGYVETLQGGTTNDPELSQKFLGTIARNAERLQFLIEDLLVISELESGSVQLQLQPLPLQRVVLSVFEDFRKRADERGVRLVDKTGRQQVSADEARLEQVLCNLVDNALKYGAPNSDIVVGARAGADGFVEVFVRNDGPGIAPNSLNRLFERFYRVDKGRSRDKGGTGLGLAIVKHIVQNHGGKAWASSEPGKGTTFYFTLPQAPSSAAIVSES